MPTDKAHGYQIIKTCEALADAGMVLTLIVPNRRNAITDEPFNYYQAKNNLQIIKLPVIDYINNVPAILKPFAFYLERYTFWLNVKKIQLDTGAVMYTRDFWLAIRLKKNFKIPVFLEMHSLPSTRIIKRCININGFLCLTKWMQQKIKDVLITAKTIWLPDSVDLNIFESGMSKEDARQALGINANAKLIVYGGRFTTLEVAKGLGMLDECTGRLAKVYPELELYLVGGSKEDFTRSEGRNSSSVTTCIKSVTRDRLAMYYKAADILAMPFPSKEHYVYEMSPLKMFEYMASGTPIISSDLPSVREILNDESAFFYNADNAEDLLKTMENILINPNEAQICSRRALAISYEFTWGKRAKAIFEFIGS